MAPPRAVSPSGFTASVDRIEEREWHECLTLFADATVYQTWAYGSVSWGRRSLSHLVVREGERVVGMAQFRIVRVPLLGTGIAYLRWGPLHRLHGSEGDPSVLRALIEAITDEYVRRRGLLVRIVPNAFQADSQGRTIEKAYAAAGFKPNTRVPQYRTIRVDLSAPPDQMRKRLDQKWRNQLNGAERNGLEIIEGTSEGLFDRFAGIYRELLERKQFDTTVDIEEFRRIQRELPDHLKMPILLAEKEGKLMAGLVASALGDTGIYLLGATSAEGAKAKGWILLQWRMMQWLKERGCRWYDLGGINPEKNPGVCHFKSGLGGQEVVQSHRHELSGSMRSRLCVSAGENLKRAAAFFKASRSGGGTIARA